MTKASRGPWCEPWGSWIRVGKKALRKFWGKTTDTGSMNFVATFGGKQQANLHGVV